MSVEMRGRRGVVGDLPILQAHAVTVLAVVVLLISVAVVVSAGVAVLGFLLRVSAP